MTSDYGPRVRIDGGVLRDIFALLLLIGGVTGLAVAGFATDWRLGVAVLATTAVAAGAYLGYGT